MSVDLGETDRTDRPLGLIGRVEQPRQLPGHGGLVLAQAIDEGSATGFIQIQRLREETV